jgi:hypothetical protein
MLITVGPLLLTALYVGMVVALKYLSPSECLDDLCQSEAVDNTILNWASDFFLAFWIFIFALQLSFSAGDVRKTAIFSQILMGGAFVAAGVGNWLYPNSGIDDNHGMLGYWIVSIIFAVFFTISGLGMSYFSLSVSETTSLSVPLCALVLVLSLSGFLTGSIWCAMEPDLQVDEVVDNFEPTDEIHACFHIMNYSVIAMNFSYALLWLPVGFLLTAASQKRPARVLGLPTPIAAIVAMVTQWTVGSMLLVVFFLVDLITPKMDYFDAWNAIYGTVLYHWAMLMTLYCLHNLSYGLPLRYYDSEEEECCWRIKDQNFPSSCQVTRPKRFSDYDEGPPPLSWEWWVTMVAGVVQEPKQKTNDNEEKETERKEFDEENGTESNPDDAPRNSSVTFEFIEEEIAM